MKTRAIFNINYIVNANATPMVDGSTWVKWSLDRMKEGVSLRRINTIAKFLND